ncbi:aldolase/citrate lyase family protein [Dactylosporangium sp. CA-092794]|uniref:aldolase/citrate lyase family protein n=1 Tax=Dactylosporangium sp. CA-092794 TaxID=3239929 RepID=UPI003D8C9826
MAVGGLAGVCPSAAASAPELAALAAALAEAEEAAGLPVGHLAVMPAVETAAGVLAAAELARVPRVVRLLLAEAALVAELRLVPGPDERELLSVRSTVVTASAAARVGPPVADVCPDQGRFAESSANLRRLGFGGRLCAGPEQLELAARIFVCA